MPVCPACGTENAASAIMCERCGTRLEPVAETGAGIAERLLDQAFRYSDEGRLDEAIKAAEQAVAANPNSTSAHSLLGILYERAGRRQSAISQYERALSLSPRSAADRQALRQLMTPGAAARPAVTRAAVVGLFVVACALLVAGIGMVLYTGPSSRPTVAGARPGAAPVVPIATSSRPSSAAPVTAAPAAMPSVPGAIPSASRVVALTPPPPTTIAAPTPTYWPTIPTVAAPMIQQSAPLRFPVGPQASAALRIQPPPTLTRPAPTIPMPAAPTVPSEQVARTYYFERDYAKATATYEKYIDLHRDSPAHVHQELAWCYYRQDRTEDAIREYSRALARYKQESDNPETRDEAQHGIRSCQAALAALRP